MTAGSGRLAHGEGPIFSIGRALLAHPRGLTVAQLREVTGLDGHTLTRALNNGRYSGRWTKTMTRLSLAQAGGQYGREWGYVWRPTAEALKPCACWRCGSTKERDRALERQREEREQQLLEIRRRARRQAA